MSRLVLGNIVVGDPDLGAAEECPICLFDAVLTFPLFCLSEAGVSNFGTYRGCARCSDTGCSA